MIISHEHQFIFIKTRKVAGTSVELFLSQFCGEEDILTTMGPDEKLREGWARATIGSRALGAGTGWFAVGGPFSAARQMAIGGFYPHIPANEIRRLLREETWNSYFKFTFERNPWDRQVSLYHFHYHDRETTPRFDRFIRSPFHRKISSNFDTYAIGGKVAADYVCRYETLDDDLASVLKQLGIHQAVKLSRAKGKYRSERA